MQKKKAALHRGNDNSAYILPTATGICSITRDVLLAVAGVALIVGVPFLMALMKQIGVW